MRDMLAQARCAELDGLRREAEGLAADVRRYRQWLAARGDSLDLRGAPGAIDHFQRRLRSINHRWQELVPTDG